MTDLTYWRLCETLTPVQAAALLVGVSPGDYCANGSVYNVDTYYLDDEHLSPQFQAALSSIASALRRGTLIGEYTPHEPRKFHLSSYPIGVHELRVWLASRGFSTGFFFPAAEASQPDYLNTEHPGFAPKLAAAIRAWQALQAEPERLRGKTPKRALQGWLQENASSYGLTRDDGSPNKQAIEEISKLANWKPKGGASKTPG